MASPETELGTGVLCDRQGNLQAVIRDDLGLCAGLQPGSSLSSMVERAETEKCRQFLGILRARGAAFDWLINVRLETGIAPVHFAGSALGDRLLVAASPTRTQLVGLHDELLRARGEKNASRRFTDDPIHARTGAPDRSESWFFDEIMRLNNELVNVQRALSKSNAELELTNRELDQKSRQKSKFLRSFGHETRTPLNAILSISGMLQRGIDGDLTSGQREQVDLIRESAQHMLTLVNDLLDLSKAEAGVIEVNPEAIDVGDLLKAAAGAVAAIASEKGLKLGVSAARGLPPLRTDFKLCRQVLLNLLGNAVKYTDRGEVTLTADSVSRGNQLRVRIQVRDTGIGIPADRLDEIFEEFARVQDWGDERQGSGLGLTIARKLLDTLGGEIEVESSPGEGSCFSLTLPFNYRF